MSHYRFDSPLFPLSSLAILIESSRYLLIVFLEKSADSSQTEVRNDTPTTDELSELPLQQRMKFERVWNLDKEKGKLKKLLYARRSFELALVFHFFLAIIIYRYLDRVFSQYLSRSIR